MNYSRRELGILLAALSTAKAAEPESVLPSKCYPFDSLPVKTNPKTQNESRQVFSGETHDGHHIDLHITTLQPGQMPHPAHHHVHEEIMLIQQGAIEMTISGQTTKLGPGSVAYVHSNDEHSLKNTGSEPAQYFVLALGSH